MSSLFNKNEIVGQNGGCQDEEQRDMMFLKFSRHALNMNFSVGTIMGAIIDILDKKESACLSESGIVEKICAMQDQKREMGFLLRCIKTGLYDIGSFDVLEESVYKTYIEISPRIQEVMGNSVHTVIIKQIIRKLLLEEDHGKSDQHHGKIMEISWNFVEEGKSINEDVVVDLIFDAQEEQSLGQEQCVEGDSITILNPIVRTQDSLGPQSVLTTNMGSGNYVSPPSGNTSTYKLNHRPVSAMTEYGPLPPLQSGVTDPQPSASGFHLPMTNGQSIGSQILDKNGLPCNSSGDSSSNGSQNSSGSSMPLGASASTYQGPRQINAVNSATNDPHKVIFKYQQCYNSFKDIPDGVDKEYLAGQMLCVTVDTNLQCMECYYKSKLGDTVHHEEYCPFKNGNKNTPNSSSLTQTQTAQSSSNNNSIQSSSTGGQSNIAQSNSGCSGDINKKSMVVPIEDDWIMLETPSAEQEEEDFKLACRLHESELAGRRDSEEMGACGGKVKNINTSNREIQQSKYCGHESECVKTATTCGVCRKPINGCGLADLSFRTQRGVLADPKRVGVYLCQGCKEKLCDILLLPCGHFVCDACRPSVPSDGCKICGQVVDDCARTDINVNC